MALPDDPRPRQQQGLPRSGSGGGGGGGGIPVGTQELRSVGYGYVQTFEWNGSRWEPLGSPMQDYGPDATGGGGWGYQPGYGETQEGYLASLDLRNRELNESIRSSQQRLDEIRMQEEAAGGRLDRQLSAERDRLTEQLTFNREQLAENKRQWDEELAYKKTYDDRSLGLSERDVALRELTGERNYELSQREQALAELQGERGYEVDLKQLDLQSQSLAVQQRQMELQHQVDLGRLSIEQAQLTLQKEIEGGKLQLGKEELAQRKYEFGKTFALESELGRGRLDVERGRLGLETELGRGELAMKKAAEARQLAATYSEQFGKDPVRQALFSLGLKGGMSPQEAAFRSMGLQTGGGGAVAPINPPPAAAVPQAGQAAIITGEAGPEVVTQTPTGQTQVLPVVGAAAEGGTFDIRPTLGFKGVMSKKLGALLNKGAATPTPTTAPPPTPAAAPAAAPASPYGPLYTPSYEPDNSGWDAILKNIQENADATAKTTADTLGRALGVQGITIDKNKGVLGLPTAQKAARAYLESGIPVQNLITSGYSVGGEYGGTPAEEFLRQIMDVTPRGALQY